MRRLVMMIGVLAALGGRESLRGQTLDSLLTAGAHVRVRSGVLTPGWHLGRLSQLRLHPPAGDAVMTCAGVALVGTTEVAAITLESVDSLEVWVGDEAPRRQDDTPDWRPVSVAKGRACRVSDP